MSFSCVNMYSIATTRPIPDGMLWMLWCCGNLFMFFVICCLLSKCITSVWCSHVQYGTRFQISLSYIKKCGIRFWVIWCGVKYWSDCQYLWYYQYDMLGIADFDSIIHWPIRIRPVLIWRHVYKWEFLLLISLSFHRLAFTWMTAIKKYIYFDCRGRDQAHSSINVMEFCSENLLACGCDCEHGGPAVLQLWDFESPHSRLSFPANASVSHFHLCLINN